MEEFVQSYDKRDVSQGETLNPVENLKPVRAKSVEENSAETAFETFN